MCHSCPKLSNELERVLAIEVGAVKNNMYKNFVCKICNMYYMENIFDKVSFYVLEADQYISHDTREIQSYEKGKDIIPRLRCIGCPQNRT